MSDVAVEYLVVGDQEQMLVRGEVEHELLEIGTQGPPGPAFGSTELNMDGHSITNVQVVGFQGEVDNGDSGYFKTIMLAYGQKQKVRLTLADTPVLEISASAAPVGHYQLRIIQDELGGRAAIFQGLQPGRWLNSETIPPLNLNPFGESVLSLFWDGSQFIQSLAKVGAL